MSRTARTDVPDLEFWLFPPQGDSEEAVRERALKHKDVCEEVICMDLATVHQTPDFEDVEATYTLGGEMLQSLGPFQNSNGCWRDEGLCLIAIAAEGGDQFARETLAHEISREIGYCMAETQDTRIPPQWIRPLTRRVVDLLSGNDTLLPHSVPSLGNGEECIWMSGQKADGRMLFEYVYPHVREAVETAAVGLDIDLEKHLSRVLQSRCCQPGPMNAAANMLANSKGDGCIRNPGRLARHLHYGAACLGDRSSMMAMCEYLLIESGKPENASAIEELYSQIHGWLEFACTDFRRFTHGSVRETIRNMATVRLGVSRGPLAAIELVGVYGDSQPVEARPLGRVSLTKFNRDPDADHPNREVEKDIDHSDDLDDPIIANAAQEERDKRARDRKDARAKRKPEASSPSASSLTVVKTLESASKAMQELYAPLLKPLPLAAVADVEAVRQTLKLEFPWFESVIDLICDDLWQRRSLGDPAVRFRPVLLHGGAGVGKTTFAMRLAQLLGTPALSIPAAGANSSQMLKGLSKGYHGAHPSGLVEFMMRKRCANPLAIVDEVDKIGEGSHNGNLIHTLLPMLERQSAKAWMDECLCTEIDLSRVSWILTANKVEHLPGPLLSRVRMFEVQKPKFEHFFALYHGIINQLSIEAGLPSREFLPQLDDLEIEVLQRSFKKNPTARSLKSKVERLIGLRSMRVPPGQALN